MLLRRVRSLEAVEYDPAGVEHLRQSLMNVARDDVEVRVGFWAVDNISECDREKNNRQLHAPPDGCHIRTTWGIRYIVLS